MESESETERRVRILAELKASLAEAPGRRRCRLAVSAGSVAGRLDAETSPPLGSLALLGASWLSR
jgi:hypothetical protein